MTSRYFTWADGYHFPNNTRYVEVTSDNEYIRHLDDGTKNLAPNEKGVDNLSGCLGYVRGGIWVELSGGELHLTFQSSKDMPETSVEAW